jgi:hypothetical protein
VSIANSYEHDLTEKQIRHLSYRSGQWKGPVYDYRIEGQGGIKHAKILGSTGRALTFDEGNDKSYYISILRNPLDVIGSTYRKYKSFETTFANYKETLMQMAAVPSYYMYHEYLVSNPRENLTTLLSYLDLRWERDWLDRAISIITPEPILSRQYLPWTEEQLREVQDLVEVDFRLKLYRGDIK